MAHDLPFPLDALYCEEEHWEEEDEGKNYIYNVTPKPLQLLEQDLLWEEDELPSLLFKEQETHLMYNTLETNSSLTGSRNHAVEWILNVSAYYSFSALTAVLAVNYFDRFLFSFHFQREKPWMSQLAAVACLSLAAKVEETQVPLLLDLQVEETSYAFEAKTIQRMEILVLSMLQWKMNPVTPLSFVIYIPRRLGLKNNICCEFLNRCESLILCIISDFRFTNYLPSVLATATMLHVINTADFMAVDYQNQILDTLGLDKEKVEECYKLIINSTSDFGCQSRKRKFRSNPGSPNGVMDVCFSSDSSNDSWAVTASVSSSPEPLSKRTRGALDNHHHC